MEAIVEIGPECFTNDDATVISFKGENYYKACNAIVTRDSGGTTGCVKRQDHQSLMHEDFNGQLRKRRS